MPAKKKTSFEDDLANLERIVAEVEDGQTPLDKSLALYKDGLALAAKCGEALTKYEQEILTLQKNADATFSLQPFGD